MQSSDVIWLFREHQKPTNIDRRKEISAAFIVAIHPLVRSRHYAESEVAVRQILTRSLGAPPSVVALCESALIQICRAYSDAYTKEADQLLLEQICGGTYFPASG